METITMITLSIVLFVGSLVFSSWRNKQDLSSLIKDFLNFKKANEFSNEEIPPVMPILKFVISKQIADSVIESFEVNIASKTLEECNQSFLALYDLYLKHDLNKQTIKKHLNQKEEPNPIAG